MAMRASSGQEAEQTGWRLSGWLGTDFPGGILHLRIFIFEAMQQCCGVGVETGVGVGQSRPFCLELESEVESDSGPESQDTNRQQPMILDEQLCIVLKT